MVALPLVLDQPWLEPTSTTTVIVGMNVLGTSVECAKLEDPGQEVLLHVKRVSQLLKCLLCYTWNYSNHM